nr:N-acetylmuramoyl-L-alanine amidase [uncultured Lichenicoccus sp.]
MRAPDVPIVVPPATHSFSGKMPDIRFHATSHHSGNFRLPSPIGLVLHRTDCSFGVALSTFTTDPTGGSAHFLIGKKPPNLLQLVDTRQMAWHVKGMGGHSMNALYLGIEFESVHRGDAVANADPLTQFQKSVGRILIQRLCTSYNIPMRGPPTRHEVALVHGHFSGIMNHGDLTDFSATHHADRIRIDDWEALVPKNRSPGDFVKAKDPSV